MTDDEISASNMRFDRVDPNASYNLPADPWVLRVRWRKDGMRSFSTHLDSFTDLQKTLDASR